MPQMSPMWWLTLMLAFNLTILIMNSTLFFNKPIKMPKKDSLKKSEMEWKW